MLLGTPPPNQISPLCVLVSLLRERERDVGKNVLVITSIDFFSVCSGEYVYNSIRVSVSSDIGWGRRKKSKCIVSQSVEMLF